MDDSFPKPTQAEEVVVRVYTRPNCYYTDDP